MTPWFYSGSDPSTLYARTIEARIDFKIEDFQRYVLDRHRDGEPNENSRHKVEKIFNRVGIGLYSGNADICQELDNLREEHTVPHRNLVRGLFAG